MIKLYHFFVFVILLSGCSFQNDDPKPTNNPNLRELSLFETGLINSSNEFAIDLIKEVNSSEDENFFISPLSVEYALGMVANGAKGTTKEAIKSTLDISDLSDDEVNEAFQSLTKLLLEMDKKVDLSIANSIWYRDQLTIKEKFEQQMISHYDAKVSSLNFSDPNSNEIINDWIENKTNNLITDMIDHIPAEAVMYLVNAIYFKADWMYEFNPELTKKAPFHPEIGSPYDVEMMQSSGVNVSRYLNDEVLFIEIPYGNGQFVMDVVMPVSNQAVSQLINSLTISTLEQWLYKSDTLTVKLNFPKFKFGYNIELNDHLNHLGMGPAFSNADFSDLFEDNLDFYISKVIHKSAIEVNEQGSEAAAVTVVEVGITSVGGGEPITITVNRPFFFMIREQHSDAILFAGKMTELNNL